MIEDLIRALKENTNLHTLSMTNVKFSEDHAVVSEEGERKREGKLKKKITYHYRPLLTYFGQTPHY